MNICITGAAGQIAYSFIPLLLSGQVFKDVKINLRLLDIPALEQALKGLEMELEDSLFQNLQSVQSGSDPSILFKDADLVIFLGGYPMKQGMERKDLLQINANIFKQQGEILNQVANKNVKCLVIANPANTNCYILSKYAPNIPKQNFTCLTRLDQNRAYAQIAKQHNVDIQKIDKIIIWGNHSTTQYPGLEGATVDGQKVLLDQEQSKQFIHLIQNRGGAILKARNNSSVLSAAQAVKDHLSDWYFGSNKIVSMGVISDGQYGIQQGICSSFPIKCNGNFEYNIDQTFNIDEQGKLLIDLSIKELLEEINESGL
ncbi:hypothetical protein pb186bvf_010340 [Paramecium bursaria]